MGDSHGCPFRLSAAKSLQMVQRSLLPRASLWTAPAMSMILLLHRANCLTRLSQALMHTSTKDSDTR